MDITGRAKLSGDHIMIEGVIEWFVVIIPKLLLHLREAFPPEHDKPPVVFINTIPLEMEIYA